jgi:hypothetical protein
MRIIICGLEKDVAAVERGAFVFWWRSRRAAMRRVAAAGYKQEQKNY